MNTDSVRELTEKVFFRQIAKWTLIGFLSRLLLMPFTMHGQDLVFINYFPMKFATEGIWNVYGYIGTNLPYFGHTYYGPGLLIIMSIVNFVFLKLFDFTSLAAMLNLGGGMLCQGFTTVDFVNAFFTMDLFRNLFLMKSSYLVFDFAIAGILLKLATSRRLKMAAYKIWMLNIVVMHSAYAIGQFELIPTFFVILALLAAVRERPYISIISLCLGGATKVFPFIMVLPAVLLLGNSLKKRFLLLFTGVAVTLILYLPFYFSSGNIIIDIFRQGRYYSGSSHWILTGFFLILYLFLCINAMKDSQSAKPQDRMLYYFLTLSFLTYAVTPISFRYFVFVTPLLALFLPRHIKFGTFIIVTLALLAFLRLPGRELQMGLFVPLNPDYFASLPSFQEIVGRFINIEIIYKIAARILLLMFFIATWWIWHIKMHDEKEGAILH